VNGLKQVSGAMSCGTRFERGFVGDRSWEARISEIQDTA
jgi:hypothetical protein